MIYIFYFQRTYFFYENATFGGKLYFKRCNLAKKVMKVKSEEVFTRMSNTNENNSNPENMNEQDWIATHSIRMKDFHGLHCKTKVNDAFKKWKSYLHSPNFVIYFYTSIIYNYYKINIYSRCLLISSCYFLTRNTKYVNCGISFIITSFHI